MSVSIAISDVVQFKASACLSPASSPSLTGLWCNTRKGQEVKGQAQIISNESLAAHSKAFMVRHCLPFISRGSKALEPSLLSTQGGELVLSADLLAELSPDAAAASRAKTIQELTAAVKEQRLQEMGVELLWMKTKDLLDAQVKKM